MSAAPSLNYSDEVESLQQAGNRLASQGHSFRALPFFNAARNRIDTAYESDQFTGAAHSARVQRDIAAASMRTCIGLLHKAPDIRFEPTPWETLETLSVELGESRTALQALAQSATGDLAQYRPHLRGEAGISGVWRMRLYIARAALNSSLSRSADSQADLDQAKRYGEQAEEDVLAGGNGYYTTSLYCHMARLAFLRREPVGDYLAIARGAVVEANKNDPNNFRPALLTYLRTCRDIRLHRVKKAILAGGV